jgi:hypothetical protein
MADAQALAGERMNQEMPRYQIAGLSGAEQQAMRQAQQSQGQFQPFLNQASGAITAGQGLVSQQGIAGLQQGMGLLGQGAAGVAPQVQQAQQALYGATGQFSPSGIGAFMNPYEQSVIDQTMADIGRQGQIAQQGLQAQAVGKGAFGGSRQAVAQQELQRNVLEQQARSAGQLRQAGFESAGQRAQQAFEQAQGRGLAAAGQAGQLGLAGQQAIGQFGQGIGGLAGQFGTFGQQLGQLGVQQAGIGQLGQQMTTQDMQNLLATGSLQRGVQQAGLDAERLSNLQNLQQPFQSLGFLSDIYSGVPSGQSTVTASSMPQVSPFQTLVGLGGQLGTAAIGARQAGII